jgi:plasmid stabilization system protein ParE
MVERKRAVIWSADARADLEQIWTYCVRVVGPNTAAKFVREISEAVRPLEEHPFAGRSRNEVRHGLRSVVASPD